MENSSTPYLEQWFRRVWNNREEAAIEELMSPEVAIVDYGPTRMNGIDYMKYLFNKYHEKFSKIDIKVTSGWGNGEAEIGECFIKAMINDELIEARFTAVIAIKKGKIVLTSNDGNFQLDKAASQHKK